MQHPPSLIMQHPVNNQYQQNPRSISHHLPGTQQSSFNNLNNHPSQSQSLNLTSQHPSRIRIHSYQQPRNESDLQPLIQRKDLNLEKLRGNGLVSQQSGFKQSNGIMNQPPDYISNKYTFKNEYDTQRSSSQQSDCGFFGSCCSMIKQTQRQVYLSPTQLITMNYFNPIRQQPKSLKFVNNNKSNGGSVVGHPSQQRSFFKDTSNVIQ